MSTIGKYTNRKLHKIIRDHTGTVFDSDFLLSLSGYLQGPVEVRDNISVTVSNGETIIILPEDKIEQGT